MLEILFYQENGIIKEKNASCVGSKYIHDQKLNGILGLIDHTTLLRINKESYIICYIPEELNKQAL